MDNSYLMQADFATISCLRREVQKLQDLYARRFLNAKIRMPYMGEMEEALVINIDFKTDMVTVILNDVYNQFDVHNKDGHPILMLDMETLTAIC